VLPSGEGFVNSRITTALLLAVGMSSAQAALTSYTSKAAFDSAIASFSAAQTVDFDSILPGTLFASGTGTGGLTFTYSIAGQSIQVADTFATTSGSNYLGLDNPDTAFYLGDSFSIGFNRTVHAVGLYLIGGMDIQAGDFELSVANGSMVNNVTADRAVTDGQAFYLGLVETNPGLGFTSATVRGVLSPGAFVAFTADDITVSAIPEPAAWALLWAGLGMLALRRMRNAARKV
jgi:hypothetical protein